MICHGFNLCLQIQYEPTESLQANSRNTCATWGIQPNELLLKSKILDEVIATHEKIPAPEGVRDLVGRLHYIYRVAEWEEAIATLEQATIRRMSRLSRADMEGRNIVLG
jgi:hypothetical protein